MPEARGTNVYHRPGPRSSSIASNCSTSSVAPSVVAFTMLCGNAIGCAPWHNRWSMHDL